MGSEISAAGDDRPSLSAGLGFAGLSFLVLGSFSLVTSIVLARTYGVRVVGQVALSTAPMGALWFLSTVGEQPAMIRLLAPLPRRSRRVASLFGATFAFSSLLTLSVAIVIGGASVLLFRGPVHHPELLPAVMFQLGMYVLLVNACWNIDSVFAAFRDGRQLFRFRLTQYVVYLIGLILLHGTRPDLWGPILAMAASWAVSLALRLLALPRYVALRGVVEQGREGLENLPAIVTFGLKLTPGTIALGLSDDAGTWILGSERSVFAVGAYSRAWQLARRLVELNWRITEMLYPTLVTRRNSGLTEDFDRAFVDSLRYATVALLAPVSVGSGAAGGVMALFGPGFAIATPAVPILLLVPVIATAGAVQSSALMALERPLTTTVVNLTRFVVTISLGLPLSRVAGLTGMAWAVLAGAAAALTLQSVLLHRSRRIAVSRLWPVRQMAAIPLAYGAGFGASAGVERLGPGPVVLALSLVVGLGAYIAVILVVGALNERDRARVRHAVAYLRRHPPTIAERSESSSLKP